MKKLLIALFSIPSLILGQYSGTGAVTQGLATTTAANLYTCTGGRVTNQGSITATDASVWVVPAVTNFTNSTFPLASNLHNVCDNSNYANTAAALAALNETDIVTVDAGGEVITAYIFADNYFEMYINGIAVGKDNVPYTQFNSNIIRFRVNRPFTIAMLLVDWEENLGLGTEVNSGFNYFAGDGGMVAIFKDANGNVVDKTSSDWKAQTYYIAPIINLTCPTEVGNVRLSSSCSTTPTNAGGAYYGLHWNRPANWTSESFNDANFPNANTYTNAIVGVNSKPAFTNFLDLFDDPSNDAEFIWSSNLILDNEVIVRHTVAVADLNDIEYLKKAIHFYPNPANDIINLKYDNEIVENVNSVEILNALSQVVYSSTADSTTISIENFPSGVYTVHVQVNGTIVNQKLIIY